MSARGSNGWIILTAAAAVGVGLGLAAFVLRSQALVAVATVPYVLATAGAIAGAAAFTRHDRMLWAWVAIAAGTAIGGLTCALTGRPPIKTAFGVAPLSEGLHTVLLAKTLLVNVLAVTGLVVLAQAYRSLGPRPAWYRLATVIAFAVGAVMAGPSVAHSLAPLASGGAISWSGIFSSVGDLLSITMIGPLAVTAIKMRGGKMAWPYALLTLSTLSWLAYDATVALSGEAQLIGDLVTMSLGGTFTGAAGLAKWRALAG